MNPFNDGLDIQLVDPKPTDPSYRITFNKAMAMLLTMTTEQAEECNHSVLIPSNGNVLRLYLRNPVNEVITLFSPEIVVEPLDPSPFFMRSVVVAETRMASDTITSTTHKEDLLYKLMKRGPMTRDMGRDFDVYFECRPGQRLKCKDVRGRKLPCIIQFCLKKSV